MLEATIILQNCKASFGQIQRPEGEPDDGREVYSTTFLDESGLSVTVLWDGATVREYLERCVESIGQVERLRKPKLEIAHSMPKAG